MQTKELIDLIKKNAFQNAMDADLIYAFCYVESNLNPMAVRYEDHWDYLFEVQKHAVKLNITPITERKLQMMSWGMMQVMGSVAREHGFAQELPSLCDPELGLTYGIIHFKKFFKKYGNVEDAISAYNQGNNRRTDGKFNNQAYVDKVKSAWLRRPLSGT